MTRQKPSNNTPTRPRAKGHCFGRSAKFGLLAIALLLLVLIRDDLGSAEGRAKLRAIATSLFSSADTYIFAGVLIVNALLYSLIIKYVYPTSADTRRGIARAVMLLKNDEFSDSDGSEIKHFFLIFILPVLFFASGTAEYQFLRKWL